MAQDGRDLFEPDILTQHLAGSGMPEDVGAANGRVHTGTLQGRSGNMGDRVSGLAARERFEGR